MVAPPQEADLVIDPEPSLMTLAAIEHLPSVGLLIAGCVVLWRRETRTTDRLVATLEGQTTALASKLAELKGAVEAGLAGLTGRVDRHEHQLADHARRLDEHGRRLDQHGRIIDILHAQASGTYTRRIVGDEDPPR